jgi:anaerobic ribonucleoside-triphosphate reductase
MPPQFVIKRDGKKARFDESRIKKAIGKAAGNVYDHAEAARLAEDLFADVSLAMQSRFNGKPPRIEEVEQVIFDVAKQKGPEFSLVANAYQTYSRKRAEARTVLEVMSLDSKSSTTDTALLIESDSKYTISGWNRDKVAEQLEREANLAPELARDVSKQVENTFIKEA